MKKDVSQALLETFGPEVIRSGELMLAKQAPVVDAPGGQTVLKTKMDYFRGELTFIVDPAQIVEVCRFLKDEPGLEFKMLADMAGVDYYQQEFEGRFGRFAVNYHLLSLRWNQRVRLKVFWSDGDAPIPSVSGLWASANWEERETFDMFGIEFSGHPDLRRLLMPDDWQGFPQRRDYPLGYETVQFSFNYDEVHRHKPYAKE